MAFNDSNKKTARIAGLLYLAVVLTGIFSLMYVPSKLIVWDNAASTFENIADNQMLFRLGIISGLACYIFFLFLPFALYRLLKPVDAGFSKLMVILAILSVPVYFINVQNQFTILSLVNDSGYSNAFSTDQIQAMVMLYLDQYENGMRMVHIFSGLWLFPFGYLVYKSKFLPKFLGILLMLGCFSYLINFTGNTLLSNYPETGIGKYISLPATIGEIGICLWLLIIGVKKTGFD